MIDLQARLDALPEWPGAIFNMKRYIRKLLCKLGLHELFDYYGAFACRHCRYLRRP